VHSLRAFALLIPRLEGSSDNPFWLCPVRSIRSKLAAELQKDLRVSGVETNASLQQRADNLLVEHFGEGAVTALFRKCTSSTSPKMSQLTRGGFLQHVGASGVKHMHAVVSMFQQCLFPDAESEAGMSDEDRVTTVEELVGAGAGDGGAITSAADANETAIGACGNGSVGTTDQSMVAVTEELALDALIAAAQQVGEDAEGAVLGELVGVPGHSRIAVEISRQLDRSAVGRAARKLLSAWTVRANVSLEERKRTREQTGAAKEVRSRDKKAKPTPAVTSTSVVDSAILGSRVPSQPVPSQVVIECDSEPASTGGRSGETSTPNFMFSTSGISGKQLTHFGDWCATWAEIVLLQESEGKQTAKWLALGSGLRRLKLAQFTFSAGRSTYTLVGGGQSTGPSSVQVFLMALDAFTELTSGPDTPAKMVAVHEFIAGIKTAVGVWEKGMFFRVTMLAEFPMLLAVWEAAVGAAVNNVWEMGTPVEAIAQVGRVAARLEEYTERRLLDLSVGRGNGSFNRTPTAGGQAVCWAHAGELLNIGLARGCRRGDKCTRVHLDPDTQANTLKEVGAYLRAHPNKAASSEK
jgi:hypothetical protein